MAPDDQILLSRAALLVAAADERTDPDVSLRLVDGLREQRVTENVLVGSPTSRDNLLRLYVQRMRRAASTDTAAPVGTADLVDRLRLEMVSEVVLFALVGKGKALYVFLHPELEYLVGCVSGDVRY